MNPSEKVIEKQLDDIISSILNSRGSLFFGPLTEEELEILLTHMKRLESTLSEADCSPEWLQQLQSVARLTSETCSHRVKSSHMIPALTDFWMQISDAFKNKTLSLPVLEKVRQQTINKKLKIVADFEAR